MHWLGRGHYSASDTELEYTEEGTEVWESYVIESAEWSSAALAKDSLTNTAPADRYPGLLVFTDTFSPERAATPIVALSPVIMEPLSRWVNNGLYQLQCLCKLSHKYFVSDSVSRIPDKSPVGIHKGDTGTMGENW